MTLNDGFERTVSDWLDEQAGHGMPGYLDEVLARTTRTRQRPAWSSLERWLPVDLSTRRSMFARVDLDATHRIAPPRRLAHRGRRRARGRFAPPLPAPFGLARNGDDRDQPGRRHLPDRPGDVAVARHRGR